jgi:drug/metabolite transporter (DMT)-like permease
VKPTERSPAPRQSGNAAAASALPGSVALVALLTGALAIASSGIFVRLSQTGPTATAFWRAALALPPLLVWALFERRFVVASASPAPRTAAPAWRFDAPLLWCGAFFAGDLALWHWSLLKTSVAASTLEANLAPVIVTLLAWLLYREKPSPRFAVALILALCGVLLIVAPKLRGAGGALLGDLLGLGTAFFYAGYLMTMARLRGERGTGALMFATTCVVAVLLLPLAVTQKFLPDDAHGWLLLIGLALIAQAIGQGLIAFALAHLSATFSAVGLYLQPVAAAAYAWWFLGEFLQPVQLLGGAIVLCAIALARASTQSSTGRQSASRNLVVKNP